MRASSVSSATRSRPTTSRPPAAIKTASPAGRYLLDHGVQPVDFNQYGTRRGNHEVMMRGTFANIRIKNYMAKDANGNVKEGGLTIHYPSGQEMPIYDAAMLYEKEGVPLVVFAGIEYGNGSSRDWAAKGTNSARRSRRHRAVVRAYSPFESRRHGHCAIYLHRGRFLALARSQRRRARLDLRTCPGQAAPSDQPRHHARQWNDQSRVPVLCRIDTLDEIEYFKNGGILHYVLRNLAA